jgi:hypothetical protein
VKGTIVVVWAWTGAIDAANPEATDNGKTIERKVCLSFIAADPRNGEVIGEP